MLFDIQSNVLIDNSGKAYVCDFGLSTIRAEFQGTSYFTSSISGSIRWAAPELYQLKDEGLGMGLTTEYDVYSFGSVMLQVSIHASFVKCYIIERESDIIGESALLQLAEFASPSSVNPRKTTRTTHSTSYDRCSLGVNPAVLEKDWNETKYVGNFPKHRLGTLSLSSTSLDFEVLLRHGARTGHTTVHINID